jgi:starch synthase
MLIWMAAAENGALRGGKVGGIGDVLRELPLALAQEGHEVSVFSPAYGRFHLEAGSRRVGTAEFDFSGRRRRAAVYRLDAAHAGIRHFVIEHQMMTVGQPGRIYHDDGPDDPFATDAGRFAFFSAALAAWIERTDEPPDVLHLHDWHTAPVLMLRRYQDHQRRLRSTHCVFTIHNLSYQGLRPLKGHASSLETWFPTLKYSRRDVGDLRYRDCFNPMAVAIRMADRINTVSPGYAREILRPSDSSHGFIGGEGLEKELQDADRHQRLLGILNGCDYGRKRPRGQGWKPMLEAIGAEAGVFRNTKQVLDTLKAWPRRRPGTVMLSIGRVTDQKIALLLAPLGSGITALEDLLLNHQDEGVVIILGSGDRLMEQQLERIAEEHENFLFLCGYTEALPEMLYASCDLFLMPSTFEPCGISQMLAMRAGQPVVAHAVGGLRDTIEDGATGFLFGGSSTRAQAREFVVATKKALECRKNNAAQWRSICDAAAGQRFTWTLAAQRYADELYAH